MIFNLAKKFMLIFIISLLLILFLAPLFPIVSSILKFDFNLFSHSAKILGEYSLGSISLVLGVAIFSAFIAIGASWFISFYDFRGKNIIKWALILPAAVPAYVSAYIYGKLLEFAGPVQVFIRNFFNLSNDIHILPQVRSLSGAIIILSFSLYPYLYLILLGYYRKSFDLINIGMVLGKKVKNLFIPIGIISSRPAIFAGMALIMMETLSDFGTVEHFGITSLTVGIYRYWYYFNDIMLAKQLASLLLIVVVAIILFENLSRKTTHYENLSDVYQRYIACKLNGYKEIIIIILCLIPLFIGFVIPVIQLIIWSAKYYQNVIDNQFFNYVQNTIYVGLIASIVTTFLALLLGFLQRFSKNKIIKIIIRIVSSGYAVPGSIVALGIVIIVINIDKYLNNILGTGLLFTNSIIALVFAYSYRFLAVGINNIESGFNKISNDIYKCGKIFGKSNSYMMYKIYAPLTLPFILMSVFMVFVESIKELPATLIIRPFNFETLATKTFILVSDERVQESAIYALSIVVVATIGVLILIYNTSRSFRNN